ncbi:hypothetical protein COCON_G00189180 [Conger conger]|uniref:Uncharacterized protein n=1 Tax=Conger conger TaxID=82655 RepID=A0A9Q1D372_CONCO|nr:hypothetical protein COCON_G00189180 [Conger conger]
MKEDCTTLIHILSVIFVLSHFPNEMPTSTMSGRYHKKGNSSLRCCGMYMNIVSLTHHILDSDVTPHNCAFPLHDCFLWQTLQYSYDFLLYIWL